MHEFGHTLGLHHGGGDDIHFKPNYNSVMNYAWQFMEGDEDVQTSWRLDYSREALDPLNEESLDESKGVSGFLLPFGNVPRTTPVIGLKAERTPKPAHRLEPGR